MTSAAARKAWNEAMKATAGTAALPPALAGRPAKRRSSRNRKQDRRNQARKKNARGSSTNDEDEDDYAMAVWIDTLEGVDESALHNTQDDEDDAFDELEDLDDAGKPKRKKSRTSRKGGTKMTLPKRFLPRTLASILTEEHGRPDSTAQLFLETQATLRLHPPTRKSSQKNSTGTNSASAVAAAARTMRPRRKFCPVTGQAALYTDPVSGLPYATLGALGQIRERPPPWKKTMGGGSAAFREAQLSILGTSDEDGGGHVAVASIDDKVS